MSARGGCLGLRPEQSPLPYWILGRLPGPFCVKSAGAAEAWGVVQAFDTGQSVSLENKQDSRQIDIPMHEAVPGQNCGPAGVFLAAPLSSVNYRENWSFGPRSTDPAVFVKKTGNRNCSLPVVRHNGLTKFCRRKDRWERKKCRKHCSFSSLQDHRIQSLARFLK